LAKDDCRITGAEKGREKPALESVFSQRSHS
jgi:hypothetical protein